MSLCQNKIFTGLDFASRSLQFRRYEEVTFERCLFIGLDLGGHSFQNCTFKGCQFSEVGLKHTKLSEVEFLDSKLTGLNFSGVEKILLNVCFKTCKLQMCSFCELPLKGTIFKGSFLKECRFDEANLTQADFTECDLLGTQFLRADLKKALFQRAKNININPKEAQLEKAHFSADGALELALGLGIIVDD